MSKKIQRYDQLPRVTKIPDAGTVGAVVGKDLRWPDGTVVQEGQIRQPAAGSSTGNAAVTLWRLVREIPLNIQRLAVLASVGFTTRDTDGNWFQRSIGEGIGIDVQNGDGVAGNPIVSLEDLPNSGTGTAIYKTTRDAKGRTSGQVAATTSDLPEGTNRYFTDARADARADSRIAAQKGQPNGLASLGTDGKVPAAQLPTSSSGVTSVNARTGAVAVPDFVSKATAPIADDYGRALINGDRWRNTGNGVLYTYQDGAWLYDNAASLSRYVPARLSSGTASPIPLNADGTIPAKLSNGTVSNIQTQA